MLTLISMKAREARMVYRMGQKNSSSYRPPKLSTSIKRMFGLHGKKERSAAPQALRLQRCIVKASITRNKASNTAHLAYIQRDGVGKDGAAPVLMGNMDIDKKMSPYVFRFIVSPESKAVDLKVVAESFIKILKTELGKEDVVWTAAAHYNTANPHLHFVVDGKTEGGERLRFKRDFIKKGLRERLSRELTRLLGPRMYDSSTVLNTDSLGYTKTDKSLEQLARHTANIPYTLLDSMPVSLAEVFYKRLQYLTSLGFVDRTESAYRLAEHCIPSLRAASMYSGYLECRAFIGPSRVHSLKPYIQNSALSGRVLYCARLDEQADENTAIVIENSEGLHFVAAQHSARVKPGDTVEVKSREKGGGIFPRDLAVEKKGSLHAL